MTYPETLDYLLKHLPMYQRIGAAAYKADLGNTLTLLDAMGKPEQDFPSIHVAGTNGKGSVSHLLASCLQEAGYKTGLYTSPHLKNFRERIRINGEMIPEDEVTAFVTSWKALFDQVHPSFFEMTVALAFHYFSRARIDIAVIETGLGGRLDSTNVITPILSIITNIGHDHMALLGNDLLSIAREKAGIIKPGIPAIVGDAENEIRRVFEERARLQQAPLSFSMEHVALSRFTDIPGNEPLIAFDARLGSDFNLERITCPLTGNYQIPNFRSVIHATTLINKDFCIPLEAILNGFRKVKKNTGLLGRWEILEQRPLIIADTAHNKEGLEATMRQWMRIPATQRHLVLGFVDDKEVASLLSLFPMEASYYFCKPQVPRGMEVHRLHEIATNLGLKGEAYPSVNDALEAARTVASADHAIYIGGSTFVVAEII